MERLRRVLKVIYHGVKDKNYDCVGIISADEGTGKSTLLLHMVEMWYTMTREKILPSDIEAVCLDRLQFATRLKNCGKFDMIGYDEAGDISNKRSMSNFNVIIQQTYQVIRGDNIFTIFVLPSIFDLDSFFTKRRARFLIHIYKRGSFAFWSRDRLRKIIELNQHRYVKTTNVVPPTFRDTFPDYKGMLKQAYDDKKAEKMKGIRDSLYTKLAMEEGTDLPPEVEAKILKKHGLTDKKIAEKVGVGERQVRRYKKKWRDSEDSENVDD